MKGLIKFWLPSKLKSNYYSMSLTGVPKQILGRRLIKPKANRPIIQKQRRVNQELESKAMEMNLGWRLVASCVLHRYPVITPDVEKWEKDMREVQDKIETKRREWLMSQIGGTASQFIPETQMTPEEILKSLPFQPASRITEADKSNDRRSLDRKLARSVFLVVKRNRSDHPWQFPQGKWNLEETMRKASERVIDRAVGPLRRYFISNAPIGHYCYAYPEPIQKQRNQFGAKVFFYRAQLIEGDIKLETRLYTDFAWIGREEVGDYFDVDTAEYMQELLLE